MGAGGALRGRAGKQAPLLPAPEEQEAPTPTHLPAAPGTSHPPSRSNGSGSWGCADALPSADAHQPPASLPTPPTPRNCQLTGPAARPPGGARFLLRARPWARTAHVRARRPRAPGGRGRAAGRGARKFVWGLGGRLCSGATATAYRFPPAPRRVRLWAPSAPAPLAQRPHSQTAGKAAVSAGGRRAAP